jgi:pyruvate kinase
VDDNYGEAFDVTATMGPACSDSNVIQNLIMVGVTSFRFPFAKETPAWQLKQAQLVRSIATQMNASVSTIMDLPGSQPRVKNDEEISVRRGDIIVLNVSGDALDARPNSHVFPVTNGALLLGSKPGDILVVGDGEQALLIEERLNTAIITRALLANQLKPNRGLTISGKESVSDCLSPLDVTYMEYLKSGAFDRVLVSFIKVSSDLDRLRSEIGKILAGSSIHPKIVGKIETKEAVENIDSILNSVDGILVGRGDLGLHLGIKDFFQAQEHVISVAIACGQYVQVGTHLLESAGEMWIPYRAELSDLSRLISAGVSGILLSAETTIGKDPVRTASIVRELVATYQPRR